MDCFARVHILSWVPALRGPAPCVANLTSRTLVPQLSRNLRLLVGGGFVARYLAELQRWILQTETTLGQLNLLFQHINTIQSSFARPWLNDLACSVEVLLSSGACEETAILYIYLQYNPRYFPLLATAPLARATAAVRFFECCAQLAGLGFALPAQLACERAARYAGSGDFYYYINIYNRSAASAFLGAAFHISTAAAACADDYCDVLAFNYDKFDPDSAAAAVEQIVDALGLSAVLEGWPALLKAAARRSERLRLEVSLVEREACG